MKTHTIVSILPLDAEEGAFRKVEGACNYILEHQNLRLLELNYSSENPPRFDSMEFDGVLLWAASCYDWVDALLDRGVPVVNMTGLPKRQMCVVGIRASELCCIAIKHLAGLGCQDIAYVFRDHTHNSIADFDRREMERYFAATPTRLYFHEDVQPQTQKMDRIIAADLQTEQQLCLLLHQLRLPAAIWTQDDHLGVIVCKLAQQLNLRIPEDVAVLSYGDSRLTRFANPPISVVSTSGSDQGYQALALLDHLLQGGEAPPGRMLLMPPPPLIARESTVGKLTANESQMEQAMRLIALHACEGITVKELANNLGLSRIIFTRQFGLAFGDSPGEFIQRRRFQRAKELIRSTDLPISSVTRMCGFTHDSSFYRFFERNAGVTPNEYRSTLDSASGADDAYMDAQGFTDAHRPK